MPRTKTTAASVVLEVSPRTAKVMLASPSPFHIQRVNASTFAEQTDDPVAALRTLLETQPLTVRQVGVLFGREGFSLQTLELPSTDAKEIASILELQLGKLTPYPRSEILFAWIILGSFREGYTRVLLAIARKTLIDSVLQFLKSKGITPQWVGVSTEGLEAWSAMRAARETPLAEGQLRAIIDIDFTSTDCAILSASGQLLFTHSIAIGHDQLSATDTARVRWVGELVRLPRILLHEDIKGKIGRGVITGVIAGLEPLSEQLTAQWGVALELVDVLAACGASAAVQQGATATRVSYTSLIGIVSSGKLPRIDLMPHETRVSQALGVRSKHLARFSGSVAVVLFLAAMLYVERVLILRHYLGTLEARMAALGPSSQEVLEHQRLMRKIREWLDPPHSPLEVFRGLATAAGDDVTITQVRMELGKPVTIRGRVGTMAGAFAFADRLKQQGIFRAIDARPTLKPKGANDSGAEFEMFCEWTGSS